MYPRTGSPVASVIILAVVPVPDRKCFSRTALLSKHHCISSFFFPSCAISAIFFCFPIVSVINSLFKLSIILTLPLLLTPVYGFLFEHFDVVLRLLRQESIASLHLHLFLCFPNENDRYYLFSYP